MFFFFLGTVRHHHSLLLGANSYFDDFLYCFFVVFFCFAFRLSSTTASTSMRRRYSVPPLAGRFLQSIVVAEKKGTRRSRVDQDRQGSSPPPLRVSRAAAAVECDYGIIIMALPPLPPSPRFACCHSCMNRPPRTNLAFMAAQQRFLVCSAALRTNLPYGVTATVFPQLSRSIVGVRTYDTHY
jgi:hypothetical protein